MTFSEAQKETIKRLVETGHALDAQKLILKEVNSQVKGSAAALGGTLGGQINIVRENFNNWAGEMVSKMIPSLERFGDWVQTNWPQIRQTIVGAWNAIRPGLVAFGSVVVSVAGLMRKHWGTIGPIFQAAATAIAVSVKLMTAPIRILAAVLRGDWSEAWHVAAAAVMAAVNAYKNVLVWLAKKVPSLRASTRWRRSSGVSSTPCRPSRTASSV